MVYLHTQVQPKVKTAKIKSLNIHISLASHHYNSSSQVIKQCVMQGSHGYKFGLFIVLPSGLNWKQIHFIFFIIDVIEGTSILLLASGLKKA